MRVWMNRRVDVGCWKEDEKASLAREMGLLIMRGVLAIQTVITRRGWPVHSKHCDTIVL